MNISKKQIFYGWYIVVAGCIAIAMTTGVVNNCFSQFVKPVCADMGITRQQMSMNQSVLSFTQMGFAITWGSLSKRINIHRWMCISSVMMPLIYACYAVMPDIRVGYVISFVLTPFFYMVSMNVFNYVIGNWFVKNRGLALGLASMGSGIGGMIMNPVVSELIIRFGWRMTYVFLAVVMFVTMVPAMFFVVRIKPEDKGLKAYGLEENNIGAGKDTGRSVDQTERQNAGRSAGRSSGQGAAEQKQVTLTVFEGYTFAEAVRMPVFWAVLFCSVSMVVSIMSFYPTLAPHLSDRGYSVTFAAMMSSISMGALAIGKVSLGRMFDRLGNRRTVTIACSCTLIGIIAMIFCENPISLAFIVLGIGLGCSFGAVCMPLITQNIFGMKDYNSIYSKLTAATGLGSAIAPTITGWTYDVCGTYVPAYIAMAIVTIISIIVLRLALPKNK